jgi:hypothetical protein
MLYIDNTTNAPSAETGTQAQYPALNQADGFAYPYRYEQELAWDDREIQEER